MHLLTIIVQVQVLCGWSSLAEKCGGASSAVDCRAAMSSKGGEVSSREILNGKLGSGLDALAGLGDEEKLNDNRDFSCLVQPRAFVILLDVFCLFADCWRRRCRLTGWAPRPSCQLAACVQVMQQTPNAGQIKFGFCSTLP